MTLLLKKKYKKNGKKLFDGYHRNCLAFFYSIAAIL